MRKYPKLLAFLAVAMPLRAVADPPERTAALVEAFKKVKPGAPSPELDAFFDLDAFTTQVLAPRAAKLTAGQRTEFAKRFPALMRHLAVTSSGDFFRRARLTIGAPTASRDDTLVRVEALLPEDDRPVAILLRWRNARVVDVSFDGESLVKELQIRYARVIDKEGWAGLSKRLDERVRR